MISWRYKNTKVVYSWMATSRLDRRPCFLPVGRAWEGDYRLLVFTASNPQEAWIRGYHRGSEKGCGLITPTQFNTATLATTPFSFLVFSLAQDFIQEDF